MKAIRKITQVCFTTMLFVFLPLAALTLLTSKTDLVPNLKSYVVVTGSMEPTVPVGSVAVILKDRTYNVGEVIAFKTANDVTVTHRVVEKVYQDDGIYYRTQGDANNAVDTELVPQKDVVGKGLFQVMYAGKLIMWLKTPMGFTASIIVPALLFIGMELWNIKKEIEKETEKRILKRMGQWQGAM